MAVSTETRIWLALKRRIEALPAPQLPVAWPASGFEPGDAAYLSVNNIIAPPRRIMVGRGAHDRNGTLTIVLVHPLGQAVEVMQEIAGQIAAHFPEDHCMVYGGVTVKCKAKAHVEEGYRDGSWWRIPINISWRSFS